MHLCDLDVLDFAREAVSLSDNCHCPYSNFQVVAFARMLDHENRARIFRGVNVECGAYPAGVCAERVAISTGVAAGHKILTDLVVFKVDKCVPSGCFPCGMCRQVALEFAARDARFFYYGGDADIERIPLADLLPRAFSLGRQ